MRMVAAPARAPLSRAIYRRRIWVAFGLAFLASGAAFVTAVITHQSLAVPLAVAVTVAGALVTFSWRRASASVRTLILHRIRLGVVIGIAATLAYDGSRLALVELTGLHVGPFDALPLFGRALAGTSADPTAALLLGTAYHYLNGVTFAIGYCVLLRRRSWLYGVGWALLLEAAMLAVYPGWLSIDALLPEFTIMSMLGHLAYGTTLGILNQSWPDEIGRLRRRGI